MFLNECISYEVEKYKANIILVTFSMFLTLMLNQKYYIRDFLVQFLLLLIRPIDWIGCSIILKSKHPGRRIGSTFNGQYLGRVASLTYSVNIELNWVSWGKREACIPLIMKVIGLHRTTPAITRLNGICVQRAEREQREQVFKTYFVICGLSFLF